jgi:hypothetical protein
MNKKKFNKENIYIIDGKTLIKIVSLVKDMKSLTLSQAEMDGYNMDELYYISKVFDNILDNLFATKNFSESKIQVLRHFKIIYIIFISYPNSLVVSSGSFHT